MPNNELKHYGVKGMKWGVRRSIKYRSRAAAIYKDTIGTMERQKKRLENRKREKGLTDRETKRLDSTNKAIKEFTAKRNKMIKDISEKDISRGERAFKMKFLAGGLGSAALNTFDLIQGERYLQRMMNRGK